MKKTIILNDKVIASDPCYTAEYSEHSALIENIVSGEWECEALRRKHGVYGTRVTRLTIRNKNYPKCRADEFIGFYPVDSGQFGFFDAEYYQRNCEDNDFNNTESWYRRVCDMTLTEPDWGTIDGAGVASSSGFGDGVYPLYVARNAFGGVIGICIVFTNL